MTIDNLVGNPISHVDTSRISFHINYLKQGYFDIWSRDVEKLGVNIYLM